VIVADLTDHNPNVFYELAVAHAFEKPVIPLIRDGQRIPFDTAPMGTIFYSRKTHREWEQAKDELRKAAAEAMLPGHKVSNPITIALGHETLQLSGDTQAQITANVATRLEQMSMDLEMLKGIAVPGYAYTMPRFQSRYPEGELQANSGLRTKPTSILRGRLDSVLLGEEARPEGIFRLWQHPDGALEVIVSKELSGVTMPATTADPQQAFAEAAKSSAVALLQRAG
jgi:hypothetical protein